MNKKIQIIIILVIAAVFMAGGKLAYDYLSEDYAADGLLPENSDNTLSEVRINSAPDFTVTDVDGNTVKLSENYGKPVIINFWASWCGPCVGEMPHFEEMYKKHGDVVVFMMINLTDGTRETVSSAKRFIEKNGYTFPVYFDTEYSALKAYSVSSIPLTCGIDKSGNQIVKMIGELKASTLEGIIEAIK